MPDPSVPNNFAEALDALMLHHSGLLDGIAEGDRVWWIGSGVSRGQVPPLSGVIRQVLCFLRDRLTTMDESDPHFVALGKILRERLPGELAAFLAGPKGWVVPDADDLEVLTDRYSDILAQEVGSEARDYLLWDAVDVRKTYGAPSIEPGPEHCLIAILVLEGVADGIITTNWDGLIEAAVRRLCAADVAPLTVSMTNEDFRRGPSKSNLTKIHGCAVRASEDESLRAYLIATKSDMARWGADEKHARVRDWVVNAVKSRRSVVLGLSVQDSNLLAQIAKGSGSQAWPWDKMNPAYVFAEPSLKDGHRDAMQIAYGDAYDANRTEIQRASVAGMYSGALLGAVVLYVLRSKAQVALSLAVSSLGLSPIAKVLEQGIDHLMRKTADEAGGDTSKLVEGATDGMAALVRRFVEPDNMPKQGKYIPISTLPLSETAADDSFRQLRFPELALAVSVLGAGEKEGLWNVSLDLTRGRDNGTLCVESPDGANVSRVVPLRDSAAVISFKETDAWTNASSPLVILQVGGAPITSLARGPARGIGSARSARSFRREASLSRAATMSGPGYDEFVSAFRAELAI